MNNALALKAKSQPIRVVHMIAGPTSGGAARGALGIHFALRELGVDSKVINNSVNSVGLREGILRVSPHGLSRVRLFFNWFISRLLVFGHINRKRVIFNLGIEGVPFENTEVFKRADIVHYHWVNGLVSIDQIGKTTKNSLWTLRDMWPFTGGCHYSMDCKKYESECGNCPILRSNRTFDISSRVIQSKKRLPRNMKIVGVSSWITEAARNSTVFRSFDVRTIPNAIDTKLFVPSEKFQARAKLNLPQDRKIILMGASNIHDYYKGFDLFLEAIPKIKTANMLFVLFGKVDRPSMSRIDAEFQLRGEIRDPNQLNWLYSAADAVVVPSRMDAFPKTIIESMACGTPVICFDTSSFSEIVVHRKTGYLAEAFDPSDLAKGLDWASELSPAEAEAVSRIARKTVEEQFDTRVAAEKYLSLYREMLGLSNKKWG
jgi:glycosyltransferase involved in cell wall biosynthesis